MKTEFIGSRKVTILGALLFATLVTGCYDGGWGGGGPGWLGGENPGYYSNNYYSNNYYSNNVYRGYGRYPEPCAPQKFCDTHAARAMRLYS
ncbi:MAG: hypothetical protein ABSD31_18715 [Candidatus Binataceae bacterium]|jgi:hypothetical protein